MSSWKDSRIILLGGPGGVGKTTLAAALGVAFSEKGFNTIVLTVDPARRLAQALGFSSFDVEIQKISDTLYATMLDSQRYLDRVFSKFARTEEQRKRILTNPLYKTTIETLGGTQEYAAMERLFEFSEDPKWQKIIVDTPPTQNAVDLFSAPERLATFLDSTVLRWFQKSPGLSLTGLFQRGTRLAMKLLETVVGAEFLKALSAFMDDLEGMEAGFRDRHNQVRRLLQSKEISSFLLATHPSEDRFSECLSFEKALSSQGISLRALLLNRLEPAVPAKSEDPETEKILSYYRGLRAAEQHWKEKLEESLGVPHYEIPLLPGPPHDITSLAHIGKTLLE